MMAELLKAPPYVDPKGAITETHTRKLQSDILEQPEIWLWTYRRGSISVLKYSPEN